MIIKDTLKKVLTIAKKHLINAATFIAAVFLYVYEHVTAFAKKVFKRFYGYISTLTQRQIIKGSVIIATSIVVIITAVIVIMEFLPSHGRPVAVDSNAKNSDEGGYTTICIGGSVSLSPSLIGTESEAGGSVFSAFNDIMTGDINIVSIGSALSADGSAEKNVFSALRTAGVDIASVATRTCATGAENAAAQLSTHGITPVGALSCPSFIAESDGISVGIVAAYGYETEGSQALDFNCLDVYGISALKQEIAHLRDKGVHYIIVLADWGTSTAREPTAAIRSISGELMECGADLICATGSGFILPVARATVSRHVGEGNHHEFDCITAFGVGNLVAAQSAGNLNSGSVVLKITLVRRSEEQFVTVQSAEYVPVFRYTSNKTCMLIPTVSKYSKEAQDILGKTKYAKYTSFVRATEDLIGDRLTLLEYTPVDQLEDNMAL